MERQKCQILRTLQCFRLNADCFSFRHPVPLKLPFLPAAGYGNGTDLNNAGDNGNYWSSSLNTDNPNNAYYLNFNDGNANTNNNNRYNGQSVRALSASVGQLCFCGFYI